MLACVLDIIWDAFMCVVWLAGGTAIESHQVHVIIVLPPTHPQIPKNTHRYLSMPINTHRNFKTVLVQKNIV